MEEDISQSWGIHSVTQRNNAIYVDYMGHSITPFTVPSCEEVAIHCYVPPIDIISFPSPQHFLAGNVCRCATRWADILHGPHRQRLMGWVTAGVHLADFVVPFSGVFKGDAFSSPSPLPKIFQNSITCQGFEEFVAKSILEDPTSGVISLVGRVGQVDPTFVVSPLTVEPSKPRLCLDLRYIHNWMRDTPFVLETLADIPQVIRPGAYMSKLDDKSGYKNIWVTPASKKMLGFQWVGGHVYRPVFCMFAILRVVTF